jgi:hypothetical protein
MAFTGPAATVYEDVHGDSVDATAHEIWDRIEARLYNHAQVQAQRPKFHTAKLGPDETIEDFAQRIRYLGKGCRGPPMMQCSCNDFVKDYRPRWNYSPWESVLGLMR